MQMLKSISIFLYDRRSNKSSFYKKYDLFYDWKSIEWEKRNFSKRIFLS